MKCRHEGCEEEATHMAESWISHKADLPLCETHAKKRESFGLKVEPIRTEPTGDKVCECGRPITDHPHSPICNECWKNRKVSTATKER